MATAFSNTNFQFLFLRLKAYTRDECLVPTDDTTNGQEASKLNAMSSFLTRQMDYCHGHCLDNAGTGNIV